MSQIVSLLCMRDPLTVNLLFVNENNLQREKTVEKRKFTLVDKVNGPRERNKKSKRSHWSIYINIFVIYI